MTLPQNKSVGQAASGTVSLQVWIILTVMLIFWCVLGSVIAPAARQHDFLNLYTGGTLALRGHFHQIYVAEVQLRAERQFIPELPALVPFVRPPFYAAALSFVAAIPFRFAFWFWVVLQLSVYLAVLAWAKSRWGPEALTFGAIFLPAFLGIASGQDCVFMLAIVAAVMSLQNKGREAAAGAVLALGLIKFHLFVMWPLLLVLQKRWRMLAGGILIATAEIFFSFLLVSRAGLLDYVALLRNRDIERLSPSVELMINVHALALNVGQNRLLVRNALAFAVVVLAVLISYRAPFRSCVISACVASLLISPHVYGYDAALLLPALSSVLFETRFSAARIPAVFLCSPVPYLFNLAGPPWSSATTLCLLLLLVLLAREQLVSHFVPRERFV